MRSKKAVKQLPSSWGILCEMKVVPPFAGPSMKDLQDQETNLLFFLLDLLQDGEQTHAVGSLLKDVVVCGEPAGSKNAKLLASSTRRDRRNASLPRFEPREEHRLENCIANFFEHNRQWFLVCHSI